MHAGEKPEGEEVGTAGWRHERMRKEGGGVLRWLLFESGLKNR